jgi:hypothetical protein
MFKQMQPHAMPAWLMYQQVACWWTLATGCASSLFFPYITHIETIDQLDMDASHDNRTAACAFHAWYSACMQACSLALSLLTRHAELVGIAARSQTW